MSPDRSIRRLLSELRRRKVWHVAVTYVLVGAGVIGTGEAAIPEGVWNAIQLPAVVLVLLGLPIALVLAWAYEVRPEEAAGDERVEDAAKRSGTLDPAVPAETPPGPSALGSGTTDARPGIVVLPVDNLSPDAADAYFSDGLTEEIITNLSYLRGLRVISRNSAMVLKGTGKDTRTIGRELDVRYVLEGSVRKAGDNLRITAQLIDARTDAHLWSKRYDGTMHDVFEIQESVARSIAEAMEVELSPGERRRLSEHAIPDSSAYQAYLRARQLSWQFTAESLARARQEMQNGLDLVGPNPLFYAGLAYVYFQYVNIGIENDECIRLAEEHANLALELDPGSGEAHIVLGLLDQAFRGDQRSSFQHFRSALERNPDDAHALIWLIVGHTLVGKIDETRPLVNRCLQVDPLNPVCRYMPIFVDVWGGHLDHTVEELTLWDQLEPDSAPSLFFSAMTLCHSGHCSEALSLLDRRPLEVAPDVFSQASRMLLRALRGEHEDVTTEFTTQLESTGRRDPQLSYFLAGIFAAAGLREPALHWLSNAIDRGFCNHPFLAVHDPLLDDLHGDPEFERIARRAKEEWLAFDA